MSSSFNFAIVASKDYQIEMKITNFLWIIVGLVGVILAEESYYNYWKPIGSENFDEEAFQSLQTINRQDFETPSGSDPNPIAHFVNGIIQNRQFDIGSPAVSFF